MNAERQHPVRVAWHPSSDGGYGMALPLCCGRGAPRRFPPAFDPRRRDHWRIRFATRVGLTAIAICLCWTLVEVVLGR